MTKIIGLHGFLGSANDFDFLPNVAGVDLDSFVSQSLEEISDKILTEPSHLIGYSFGARLAARLKVLYPDLVKKVILISGHMGLSEKDDHSKRLQFETDMTDKILSTDASSFVEYWNKLELFENDDPIAWNSKKDWSKQPLYFSNFGLTQQGQLLEKLQMKKNEVLFIYGKKDKKYFKYAQDEIAPIFETRFLNTGHRALNAQEDIKKIVETFL